VYWTITKPEEVRRKRKCMEGHTFTTCEKVEVKEPRTPSPKNEKRRLLKENNPEEYKTLMARQHLRSKARELAQDSGIPVEQAYKEMGVE
jgi:hypothetical protein